MLHRVDKYTSADALHLPLSIALRSCCFAESQRLNGCAPGWSAVLRSTIDPYQGSESYGILGQAIHVASNFPLPFCRTQWHPSPGALPSQLKPGFDLSGHGLSGDAIAIMQRRQGACIEECVGQSDLPEGWRHTVAQQHAGDGLAEATND